MHRYIKSQIPILLFKFVEQAQIRKHVFLAIEDFDHASTMAPVSMAQRMKATEQDRLLLFLVQDYLENYEMDCTQSVLSAESGTLVCLV